MPCLIFFVHIRTDSAFWTKKPKTIVAKTRANKKTKKNKAVTITESAAVGESTDVENPSEVELDSLGRLFIELAEPLPSQEEAATSRADDTEVISVASGSDSTPSKKVRRVVRK